MALATATHNASLVRTRPAVPHDSGITEILMPYGDDLGMVLPMLAHLSQQSEDRWFTWIVPNNFCANDLKPYGFDKNLRLIYSDNDAQSLWLFWEALSKGNSAHVAVCLNTLNEQDRDRLEAASAMGKTRGMVLRTR